MDEGTYPRGPDRVPPELTRPTGAYRRHAYLAVAGLLLFVALYFALTGWFAWTAYRLIAAVVRTPDHWPLAFPAAGAGFLAVFMAKALIFIRRGKPDGEVELARADHPRLFAFLHRLADEARAPRPYRVLVSSGVSAAVYYDFSLVNLIVPSRKNLQIGLGLVNVLTLGELKAVLAHELGHFAQNTMAIGRWIYMAQQIAGHIVVKRDALDNALRSLSQADLRIGWVGWVLRVIVWSIRSLIDTVFGWVVLAQRALSREMELQADLVAVSLTGSDALVHALHRLDAADDAMDRALGFAAAERGRGKAVADMFALQTRLLERTRVIIGDPSYGAVPALPAVPEHHRLFKAKFAQPPRMWSTHPANDVREANAKRVYIPAPLDDRSGWLLFDHQDALRVRVTAQLYERATRAPDDKPLEICSIDDTLAALDRELDKRYLDPRYHGVYLGRSVVRAAAQVAQLYGDEPAPGAIVAALDALYPAQLAADVARLRELSEQHALLRALQRGIFEAPGGVVWHRGQEHHRREIPRLIAEVDRELAEAREALCGHDRRVRTAHLAAARTLSPGWGAYLQGLAAIHHYADHQKADLEDAAGALQNVLSIALADGRVTSDERDGLVAAADVVYTVLRGVHDHVGALELGALADKLAVASFPEALEPLRLPTPTVQNIGDWLNAMDGWVGEATGALSALTRVSLDELVRSEEEVARRVSAAAGDAAGEAVVVVADAPAPPRPPASYPVLIPGSERPRQLTLGWWDRFQVADGVIATAARFMVAAAIIGCVVWAGRLTGSATVFVVNGLARPVIVAIGSSSRELAPHSHAALDVTPGDYTIRATTRGGQAIEELAAEVDDAFAHYVYNIAGAAVLVELRAGYSDERYAMASHWQETRATEMFDPMRILPPRERGTMVLVDAGVVHPWRLPAALDHDMPAIARAHARWDPPGTSYLVSWIERLEGSAELPAVIRARLADDPDDVAALRAEQDVGPRGEVCARHRQRAAASESNPAWQYLAIRCIEDVASADLMFVELAERWPEHGWILAAAGGAALARSDYDRAVAWLEAARARVPELKDMIADRLARAHRLARGTPVSVGLLASDSPRLQMIATVEAAPDDQTPSIAKALHRLYEGDVAGAAAEGSLDKPDLLVLAAASDGAPDELVARALAVPPDQLVPVVALYGEALAQRAGRDPAPYQARFASVSQDEAPHVAAFFAALGRDPSAAEAELAGLGLDLRLYALAAGTVALGATSPASWRDMAKLGLLETERPFFR